MSSFRLVVPLGAGGCSEQWVRLRGRDTFPKLLPPVASPYQAPTILALRASRLKTGVFYRAVSLMRDEWSLNFDLGELGTQAWVIPDIAHCAYQGQPL